MEFLGWVLAVGIWVFVIVFLVPGATSAPSFKSRRVIRRTARFFRRWD